MAARIDFETIRNSTPGELSHYLRHELARVDSNVISQQLLAAVDSESIPPRVFHVWLSARADSAALVDALRFEGSITVREAAIKEFGHRLCSPALSELWTALGGTKALVDLLFSSSVNQVRLLCQAIGRSGSSLVNKEYRQTLATELLNSLASDHFPDAKFQNPDLRPLLSLYGRILPACTVEMIQVWREKDNLPQVDIKRLCLAQPFLNQQECLKELDNAKKLDSGFFNKYKSLFERFPDRPDQSSSPVEMSGSMDFTLKILEVLTATPNIVVDGVRPLADAIFSLVKRLWRRRRRTSASTSLKALEVVSSFLNARPNFCKAANLTLKSESIIGYTVRLWSHIPKIDDRVLCSFIRILPDSGSDCLPAVVLLLPIVRKWLRLILLKLLLRDLKQFDCDFDDDTHLTKIKDQWPARLLMLLQPEESQALLERLTRLKPESEFLKFSELIRRDHQDSRTVLSICFPHDYSLFRLYVSRDVPRNVEDARKTIEAYKKKATTNRDRAERASCAQFTLCCAIASGSLDLLYDTLFWARRFNRDQLTVQELYSVMDMQESVDLISGVPIHPDSPNSLARLEESVRKGNEIMMLMLETERLLKREPSYHKTQGTRILTVILRVIERRLRGAAKIKRTMKLSDDDMYRAVWVDTVGMLLNAESITLDDEEEVTRSTATYGLVQNLSLRLDDTSPVSTLRFLDDLARRRNELWQKWRRARHPAVTTLSPPWPIGLPIQDLVRFDIRPHGHYQSVPYLFCRAQNTVFMSSDVALAKIPQPQDVQEALWPFVDDYSVALRFYVYCYQEGEAQTQAINAAWHHALSKLTADRMSHFEAQLYWRQVFKEVGFEPTDMHIPLTNYRELRIPETSSSERPTEWNPDPNPNEGLVKSRFLPLSSLDCMVNAKHTRLLYRRSPDEDSSTWNEKIIKPLTERRSVTVPVEPQPCWGSDNKRSLPPPAKEGLIAASLLYMDSKASANAGRRILSSSFPSAAVVRYPALFLDDEFLDRKGLIDHFGQGCLVDVVQDVPPALLLELCEKLFSSSEKNEKDTTSLSKLAFDLLQLLIEGDKPWKAERLVRHVVIDRPEDSSWHRHFLTPGFFKKQSPRRVSNFFKEIVSEMVKKLQEQANRRQPPEGTDAPPLPPILKVTTVKMVAQLLSDINFLDRNLVVEVLASLLANGKHIDVRISVIESLVALLRSTTNQALHSKILTALEQHAIPIAAALNERSPITDEDWQRTEASGEVPEITNYSTGLDVMRTVMNLGGSNGTPLAETVMERIVLPMAYQSGRSNHQCMAIFLKKQNFSPTPDLPQVPVQPEMLTELLSHHTALLPRHFLHAVVSYIAEVLQPSKLLTQINQTIADSHDLRSSNAGKHWLYVWQQAHEVPDLAECLARLLRKRFTSKLEDGISYSQIAKAVLKIADIYIMRANDTFYEQDRLFNCLKPSPQNDGTSSWPWQENCIQIIKQIIARIESLRTPK